MKTIYKYQLEVTDEKQIEMPEVQRSFSHSNLTQMTTELIALNKTNIMGLDIALLTNITPSTRNNENSIHLFNIDGLPSYIDEGYYECQEYEDVFGRAYSTYNRMRRELAKVIGKTDEEIWADPKPDIPFVELINYSDCEGCFGTEACKELAKDFNEFSPTSENDEFASFYAKMKYAFNRAANENGAIYFH